MPTLAMPEDWDPAIVVAAHPDDIEYGIASAVARWTGQGKQVSYLLATRGEAGIVGQHPDQVGPLRVEGGGAASAPRSRSASWTGHRKRIPAQVVRFPFYDPDKTRPRS